MTSDQVMNRILLPALETAKATLPGLDRAETFTAETSIYGTERGLLDSLNLVSFVMIVEDEIKRETGRELQISARDVFGAESNPFATLRDFSHFLAKKLES